MEVKVRQSRSFHHVTLNGQTVEIARWDGTIHISQVEAIARAQRIIVARRKDVS